MVLGGSENTPFPARLLQAGRCDFIRDPARHGIRPRRLLDEAFEGLAPIVVKRFRDAVLRIQEMGIALLIAESNLVNAARIADRLYAIDRGEIIFEGKPEQALEDANIMKALRG